MSITTLSDNERRLQYEIDELRAQREHDQEQAQRDREQRRRERNEEYRQRQREAESWPEALSKNAALLRQQLSGYEDEADLDEFFSRSADACDLALKKWHEVEGSPPVEALRAKLFEIKAEIERILICEVAQALEATDISEHRQIADQIRTGDPSSFLDW